MFWVMDSVVKPLSYLAGARAAAAVVKTVGKRTHTALLC